jgi:hypothetical protein
MKRTEPQYRWIDSTNSVIDPLLIYSWPATAITATVSMDEKYTEAVSRLDAFRDLENNWDGYGAIPISVQAIDHAQALLFNQSRYAQLAFPDITPTPNGTLVVEWQGVHGEAAVEIGNTRVSGVIKPDQAQPLFINGETAKLDQFLPSFIAPFLNPDSARRAATITPIDYDTATNGRNSA